MENKDKGRMVFMKKLLGKKEKPSTGFLEFPEEHISKIHDKLINDYGIEISKDQVIELLNLFDFVTKDDLRELETNLQNKFEQLISNKTQWYKTKDLEDIFGISKGKQQQLRDSKELPFTKIGKTVYYSSADIEQILEDNKSTL